MAKVKNQHIWVWLDDPSFGPLQQIGTLSRGDRGSVRFAYEPNWLKHAHAFTLDPELDLSSGEFFPGDSNFGVFMDSCPDRWGQMLMKRREAVEAKEAGRAPRNLGPWEFLLGVQDCTRMGALRFSPPDSQDFLANETLSAPPVTRIAELQAVAFDLTRKKQVDLDKIKEWLKVLVAPGSSLGGARPKANLADDDGTLWIAKFPSADDDYDVAAWEKLLHDLAERCGITVPKSRIMQIGNGYRTFLVQRFDRREERRRFFSSAMTLLGRIDMSRWKSDKHFASWLGLCPGAKISGGKVLSSATKRIANRAALAFRMAAFSLIRSRSALGGYIRRLKARLGAPKAITATAHKLARLVYSMLKNGTTYADLGQDYYEERYRSRLIQNMKRKAKQLGFDLVPVEVQPT